jgi:hypothetical protein
LLFTVSDWAYSLLHPNKLTSFKAYRLIWSSAIRV